MGKREGFTSISVSRETRRKLERLKRRVGARTWDELLGRLASEYADCAELRTRESVRRAVCNDLRESKGTLTAWLRLLSRKLGDMEAVSQAIEYLRPDPSDPSNLVVDERRCTEV